MTLKEVYDCGGECLGDEFINLEGLQITTKEAILQMIYLDETLEIYSDRIEELKISSDCDCDGCQTINDLEDLDLEKKRSQ